SAYSHTPCIARKRTAKIFTASKPSEIADEAFNRRVGMVGVTCDFCWSVLPLGLSVGVVSVFGVMPCRWGCSFTLCYMRAAVVFCILGVSWYNGAIKQ
ncbi:MAG: hypothetical protein IJF43_07115, partial [Firmicutes bacterium]|nr:hypothetical protein [Bacillota bacterium]